MIKEGIDNLEKFIINEVFEERSRNEKLVDTNSNLMKTNKELTIQNEELKSKINFIRNELKKMLTVFIEQDIEHCREVMHFANIPITKENEQILLWFDSFLNPIEESWFRDGVKERWIK